jgi:hypothetical protein
MLNLNGSTGAGSLKFCEMQVYLSDVLTLRWSTGVLGGAIAVP